MPPCTKYIKLYLSKYNFLCVQCLWLWITVETHGRVGGGGGGGERNGRKQILCHQKKKKPRERKVERIRSPLDLSTRNDRGHSSTARWSLNVYAFYTASSSVFSRPFAPAERTRARAENDFPERFFSADAPLFLRFYPPRPLARSSVSRNVSGPQEHVQSIRRQTIERRVCNVTGLPVERLLTRRNVSLSLMAFVKHTMYV